MCGVVRMAMDQQAAQYERAHFCWTTLMVVARHQVLGRT